MTFFSGLINRYLARTPSTYPPDTFYPSELGTCPRASWYRRKVAVEHPPELLRKFASATLVHNFVRDMLANSPGVRLIANEKPFTIVADDFLIKGRMDDVIYAQLSPDRARELNPSLQGEVLVVVEVKSVSGRRMDFIRSPSYPHLLQIHPYMRSERASSG